MSTTLATPGAQAYIIPFTNSPQQFEISLAGTFYTLSNFWNSQGQYWTLNIADQNQNLIASNIPIITGTDLLAGLEYIGIGGSIYAYTDGSDVTAIPTLDNLGVDSFVVFVTVNNG